MNFLTSQTDAKMKASLHSSLYDLLVEKLADADKDKFVCLKPNCLSKNRELECRKYEVLESVVSRINLLVSSGSTFNAAVAAIPDYCGCATPACNCEETAISGGSGGSGA